VLKTGLDIFSYTVKKPTTLYVYKTIVLDKAKHLKVLKTIIFSETMVLFEYFKKKNSDAPLQTSTLFTQKKNMK
jgi:hypothetical protein